MQPRNSTFGEKSVLPPSRLIWYRLIHRDYRRYIATEDTVLSTLLSQGLWASCAYRVCRGIVYSLPPGLVRKLAHLVGDLVQKAMEIVTGISIPIDCEIGEGLYIGHHGTTVLPSHGSLGKNCNIAQTVTIGLAGFGEQRGAPRIGNRVFIGAHAVIAGNIRVGDDAVIAAGAIVTRPVPPRAVMVGNPARAVSFVGSFDYIQYDGMDSDPERETSLRLRGQPEVVDQAASIS